MLEIGSPAPDFNLMDNTGQNLSLSDFRGKKLVLYFYPKDNTPGCTTEAIEFTDYKDKFEAKGTRILGVSKDSTASHGKFIEKYNLKIPLATDANTTMMQAYGVWREKKNYGKVYMGIVRTTFLIDESGKIMKIWNNVKVKGHVEAVYNAI